MAQAKVYCTCKTCKKTFEKFTVKYNRKEADNWEAWAVEHFDECPECREKRLENEALSLSESAMDEGFVALVGSEKQIRWAESIRKSTFAAVIKFVDKYLEKAQKSNSTDQITKFENIKRSLSDCMKAQTKASWWIDCRYKNPDDLVDQIMTENANMFDL